MLPAFSHIHFGWGFASPWWATTTIAFHFHHKHHISSVYHPCCCLRWLCLGKGPKTRSFLKELSQKQGHELSTRSFDKSKLEDELIDRSVRQKRWKNCGQLVISNIYRFWNCLIFNLFLKCSLLYETSFWIVCLYTYFNCLEATRVCDKCVWQVTRVTHAG